MISPILSMVVGTSLSSLVIGSDSVPFTNIGTKLLAFLVTNDKVFCMHERDRKKFTLIKSTIGPSKFSN